MAVSVVVAFRNGDQWWALTFTACTVVLLIAAYAFPERKIPSTSTDEYSAVIETIGTIGKQLSVLSEFLEKERARVADTEATVKKLNEEKTELEPLVHTQREIVDAILAAHSKRTAKHAWKERLFGFALGVVASLIASFVYEYFKR
jgi:sensor c-di-GMP phosphodiesterase-like protein